MQFFDPMALVAIAIACLTVFNPIILLADTPKHPGKKDDDVQRLKDSDGATKKWLSLVDAGDYEKSWDNSSKVLQLTVPRAQWKTIMETIREPLGKAVSRQMTDVRVSKDPQGLPPGDYMVFVYQTKFQHKDSGYEMLTLVYDQGNWQVMTYQVN